VQLATVHEQLHRGLDCILRIDEIERHNEWRDTPAESEPVRDFIPGGERKYP
jgi:hypothetical protein